MRYLLLICGDESAAAHAEEGCGGWSEEMTERGVLLDGAGLRPADEARTIRVRSRIGLGLRPRRRQLLVSDGPFAETKEQIAGLSIIECADMDEAIAVAAAHPAASYGTIEVRPML